MTECERILNQSILPTSFFESENRCEFYVDETRKKVWAIEIDIYLELMRVCKKYNLTVFTDGGTTLGAIRHKGFIPWDDDLDVCLLRADYEKLKELEHEFNEPYFLQNSNTDKEYAFSFMKLLNMNTCYEVRPFTHALFKKGIHIDIFPIDYVTLEDYIPRREQIAHIINANSAYMRKDLPNKTERDQSMVDTLLADYSSPADMWKKIESIAIKDEVEKTDYLSLLVSTQYAPQKKIWPTRVFDSVTMVPFENIEVGVPSGYDEQLKIYFGNYMEFPPIECRGTWHTAGFYPDTPYKEYYKSKYGLNYD